MYLKMMLSTSTLILMVPATLLAADPVPVDTGTTAWMLTSTALVLLMVPGLAMFYGGLVRTKNVLGTMMHSFVAIAIIGVLWAVCGYALAFGESILGGFVGWNSGGGRISLPDNGFNSVISVAQTIYHEIGHNWDEKVENPAVGVFYQVAGWAPVALLTYQGHDFERATGDG